jgi:hypothetical protein
MLGKAGRRLESGWYIYSGGIYRKKEGLLVG